jgi:hypothetical protein
MTDLPYPVLSGWINSLEKRKDGHHALKGPHTDLLALRYDDLPTVYDKIIPYESRLIAISIDSFHRHLQFVHHLLKNLN